MYYLGRIIAALLFVFTVDASQLFYETEGKSMHIKQLLNSLGIKFEQS